MVADSQGSTETLRCDNCSNAPSCCYARANYLRLTITAAENLISAGFQCQDTYSYGILVPNCLTPDYEIYIQYRMFPPPPPFWSKMGDLNRKILMGRPYMKFLKRFVFVSNDYETDVYVNHN